MNAWINENVLKQAPSASQCFHLCTREIADPLHQPIPLHTWLGSSGQHPESMATINVSKQ